ncbi:MAG TPA: PAC2 family protein [Micromonosporaceae bacterium]
MLDPHGLYELVGDLPALDRPVLVQALSGFVDAGSATRLAREHLLGTRGPELVARFDVDQLLDYRSRRPMMDFVEDHWDSYDAPELGLWRLTDAAGTPFLLLAGPEPDVQWERFIEAVVGLVERLGVRLTIGLNAIPMAVPHTRPAGMTAHATRRDLIAGYEPWLQRVRVPASVGNLLEYRLGRRDRDALGFAVHVPHYVAQAEYPAAALLLVTSLAMASGLDLPVDQLRVAADLVRGQIDEQVAQSAEAASVVRALEEQYDAFQRGRQREGLLAESGPLPTAEEIAAELERFLAEHGNSGEQPPST